MQPDKKNQLELILGSSLLDDDRALLNEFEECDETEKTARLADQLIYLEQQSTEQLVRRARRLNNYLLDRIVAENLKNQQSVFSENETMKALTSLSGLKTGENSIKERFSAWLIDRLHWLPAKDEVVFPGWQAPQKISDHSFFWRFAVSVSLAFFVLYLIIKKPPGADAPPPSQPVYGQIRTDDTPHLLNYSSDVHIAMAEQTHIQGISATSISLRSGNIWLDVKKRGRGFAVSTDYGDICVLGTSFGVSRLSDPDRYKIECSESSVEIMANNGSQTLPEGKFVILKKEGLQSQETRELGRQKARWVCILERKRAIDSIDGLLAYWDMEHPTQNMETLRVPDLGPYGYDAFADCETGNAPRLEFLPSVDTEIFGNAIQIHKKDKSWLTIPQPEKFRDLMNGFTIMSWVKINELKSKDDLIYYRILGCYDVYYGIHFGLKDSNINLDMGGENRYAARMTSHDEVITPNQWIHIAASWSAKDKKLQFYANGEMIGGGIVNIKRRHKLMDWYIGRNRYLKHTINNNKITEAKPFYFEGSIDELRIYDRVLTKSEIRTISMIDFLNPTNLNGMNIGREKIEKVGSADPTLYKKNPNATQF